MFFVPRVRYHVTIVITDYRDNLKIGNGHAFMFYKVTRYRYHDYTIFNLASSQPGSQSLSNTSVCNLRATLSTLSFNFIRVTLMFWNKFEAVTCFAQEHLRNLQPVQIVSTRHKSLQIIPSFEKWRALIDPWR